MNRCGRDVRQTGMVAAFARRWWFVPAVIAVSITAQQVLFLRRYDVGGHAAEHLQSATAPFLAVALMVILLITTPAARRQVAPLTGAALWVGVTVVVLVTNVRVADAIVAAGHRTTPWELVPHEGAIEAAHGGLAAIAPYLGVLASLLLIGAFVVHHHVSWRVGVGAGALSVVFPPWIVPGAGALVVVVARCVARERELRRAVPRPQEVPARPRPDGQTGSNGPLHGVVTIPADR